MVKLEREFRNEQGQIVTITVVFTEGNITVSVTRKEETGHFQMSNLERAVLREMMNPRNVEPAYLPEPQDPWKS